MQLYTAVWKSEGENGTEKSDKKSSASNIPTFTYELHLKWNGTLRRIAILDRRLQTSLGGQRIALIDLIGSCMNTLSICR